MIFTRSREGEAAANNNLSEGAAEIDERSALTFDQIKNNKVVSLRFCNFSDLNQESDKAKEESKDPAESPEVSETSQESYCALEHLGLPLRAVFMRTKSLRAAPMKCPYTLCERSFNETGNLKTHLRIHVSPTDPHSTPSDRLERDRLLASSPGAKSSSSRAATSRPTS